MRVATPLDFGVELRRIPLLAELSRHPFTELSARTQIVRIERERPLIIAGETSGHVAFLLAGLVKVTAGRLIVDVFRGPTMLVPCAAVDGLPSPVSVIAMRSCDVAILERAALLAAVNATPASAQRLAELVAHEARGYLRRFPELVGGSVEERLADLLDRLAERHGSPLDEGRYMALPLRRCDLAMMVHATTETVSRTLAEWERRGWLRSNRAGLWWSAKRLREGGVPTVPPRAKSDRPEV